MTVDDLALLTQRANEAELAWRRRVAAEAAWERARNNLREAWERVRADVEPSTGDQP